MQDYIENHYLENITMADLARASFYSPWYSYRLFLELTNLSPAEYIRLLKLSKSALEFRDTKIKTIDIAFKYGYNSVDGYQRAFFQEFGINPKEYSKNPQPIQLFIPYKVMNNKGETKTIAKEVKNVFITIIEKPAHKVIIKRGVKSDNYMDYCYEVGCDVWGVLKSMKSLCGEPVCLWLPKKFIKPNTSIYVQGVEVSSDYYGSIPEGFDIIDLPKCKYIMFQGEPFKEDDYCVAINELWGAIDRYNPIILGYSWDEENLRIQLEPVGNRGYIELMPIK